MIAYLRGNLLEDDAHALVNTVNTVGVMGKGIALQFKQRFPANFAAYAQACKQGRVQTGRMFITEPGELTGPRWVVWPWMCGCMNRSETITMPYAP